MTPPILTQLHTVQPGSVQHRTNQTVAQTAAPVQARSSQAVAQTAAPATLVQARASQTVAQTAAPATPVQHGARQTAPQAVPQTAAPVTPLATPAAGMVHTDDMPFVLEGKPSQQPVLKVIGIGGGGGNAVNYMIRNKVDGVEFIGANTDAQALASLKTRSVLQLGANLTRGLGAGADPALGRQAAMDDRDEIAAMLDEVDMVFITAGMGGGTGTGAAPVVAEVAREAGVLTVAVVTRPFRFEGAKRTAVAEEGIAQLTRTVDSLITIPNEKLLEVLGEDFALTKAFDAANDVLLGAVKGIADLIMRAGLINVDFADVRAVMSEMGMAMMGTGVATGNQRAREATETALRSPLLDDVNLQGARGILVNITAGDSLSLGEYNAVGEAVSEFAHEDAKVVVGTVIEPTQDEELRVTVVATGLGETVDAASPPVRLVSTTPAAEVAAPQAEAHPDPHAALAATAAPAPGAAPATNQRDLELGRHGRLARVANGEPDMDYLDIPAFLRRQAD